MSIFKKLAGDTLIYGLGTIVPKILNFSILTYYYTRLFGAANFGILQELYAYAVFLMILLTFGLETGYFRFTPKEKNKNEIYSNGLTFIIASSFIFLVLVLFNLNSLKQLLKYQENANFLIWISIIIIIDALSALPFAYLRYHNKALKFSILKLINVIFNITLVICFYKLFDKNISPDSKFSLLMGDDNLGFILLSNMACSLLMLLLLFKEFFKLRLKLVNFKVLKPLLIYSLPLVISGLAGMTNEALDKVLMKHTLSGYDLGIYSANYKIAVLLSLFIQMYRYAVEPFFFKYFGSGDDKKIYARIMNIFIGISLTIMLMLILFLDYFKFLIDSDYHEALSIIPIVLFAYLCYGIFFNLSIWYKLTNKTIFGAIITGIGAVITIYFNLSLVPKYGYVMAAWGHFTSMFVMVLISYLLSLKYYQIKYNFMRIGEYLAIFAIILIFHYKFYINEIWFHGVELIILSLFGLYLLHRENFLKPIIAYVTNKSRK